MNVIYDLPKLIFSMGVVMLRNLNAQEVAVVNTIDKAGMGKINSHGCL